MTKTSQNHSSNKEQYPFLFINSSFLRHILIRNQFQFTFPFLFVTNSFQIRQRQQIISHLTSRRAHFGLRNPQLVPLQLFYFNKTGFIFVDVAIFHYLFIFVTSSCRCSHPYDDNCRMNEME